LKPVANRRHDEQDDVRRKWICFIWPESALFMANSAVFLPQVRAFGTTAIWDDNGPKTAFQRPCFSRVYHA
jgi:hypothetical protein